MSWEANKPEVPSGEELIRRIKELAHAGEYDEALQLLETAEAENAGNFLIHYYKCFIYIHTQRFEEAVAAATRSIELNDDFAEAYCNRAAALDPLGRYEEAIADCDTAIKLKPDYEMAYYNKGVVLGDLKRYEESISSYDRAIELNPNYTYALFNRASMQACLGNREAMLADLARAIELDPGERDYADEDKHFDPYRDDPDFRKLVYPGEHGE